LHPQFDFGKLATDWGRPFGQGAALFNIKGAAPHDGKTKGAGGTYIKDLRQKIT
jgi:hypothetical protein